MNKVIIIVLAISVPVFSVLGAINIIFRMPDFYRYEFDRGEVSSNLDLGISGTDLGSFFSKYMLHSESNFSLITEYEGTDQEIFNHIDDSLMSNFRMLLDITLIVAVFALLLTAFLIFILKYNRMENSLRLSLNIGLGIYIASIAGLIVYFNVYNGDMVLRNSLMDGKFRADDLLMQMFDERFTLDSTVVIVVISFIIMMIIRYIVWRMTAQKGIFSEGLKGVAK